MSTNTIDIDRTPDTRATQHVNGSGTTAKKAKPAKKPCKSNKAASLEAFVGYVKKGLVRANCSDAGFRVALPTQSLKTCLVVFPDRSDEWSRP